MNFSAMPPRLKTTTQNTPNQTKQNTASSTNHTTHSPPKTIPTNPNPLASRQAVEQFAQAVHLIEGFADTLDAIPPSLTRSLSDLKELDAVLSGPLNQVHSTLDQLLNSFQNPNSIRPDQRLQLLQKIVSDIERYNLGGQDKIRVANGTCESLSHHIRQLDTTTSLLISSLPPSLEPKLLASTFPSGYPKLTGALRPKPVGGVWPSSTHPLQDHQTASPPTNTDAEFVHFNHQQSPTREPRDLNARSIDSQPVPKRARIGPADSSSLAASHLNPLHPDESNQTRRSVQQPGSSSKLLDQHMIFSQSSVKKHRLPQDSEDNSAGDQLMNLDHSINGPIGKSLSTGLSRQNSQHSLIASPPHPSNLSTGSKNKRVRGTSNLLGDHDNHLGLPHSALKINGPPSQSQSTPQPSPIVGPKKRARKSNPTGSSGKNTDSTNQMNEDTTHMAKRLIEQTHNTISGQEVGGSRTIADHAKATNLSTIGSIKKTSTTGVRGTNNSKNESTGMEQTPTPVPTTTKRTYTKRNGMNNGGISFSKSKRAARKKAVGVAPAPAAPDVGSSNPNVNSKESQMGNNNKVEINPGLQMGRVGQQPIFKESVRMEDVVEGARHKVRHQTLNSAAHAVSGGIQPDGSELKGERGGGMREQEDEDGTDHEGDDQDQGRLKHVMGQPNFTTTTMSNQSQQLSSSSKSKSNLNHHAHFQPNQPHWHLKDQNLSTIDRNLMLKNNHKVVHRDPKIEVPAEILSPKGSVHSNDSARTYCFCKGEVYGDRMVACDNAKCPIEWFHYQCAGLTEDPTGNWFCPDCQSKGFGNTMQANNNYKNNNNTNSNKATLMEGVERGKETMFVERNDQVTTPSSTVQNSSAILRLDSK